MSRINVVEQDQANEEQAALYQGISQALGAVPNFLKVLGNSPAALRAFLGLHGIANAGSLDAQTRERIALALAGQNECQYCASAHTAIGRKAGLDNEEMAANRRGESHDEKGAAAVAFARALVEHTGEVTNAEIQAVREAGYDDAAIVEIITHVGMNLLTNILAKASRVDIDFPVVELDKVA